MVNVDEDVDVKASLTYLAEIDDKAESLARTLVANRMTGKDGEDVARALFSIVSKLYSVSSGISDQLDSMSDYQYIVDLIRKWDSFLYRYDLPVPKEQIGDFQGSIVKVRRRPQRMIFGQVVKKSSEKTVKVQTERHAQHPKYGKTEKITKRYLVHDEFDEAHEGDFVFAVEGRPLSKLKRHRLLAIRPRGSRRSA